MLPPSILYRNTFFFSFFFFGGGGGGGNDRMTKRCMYMQIIKNSDNDFKTLFQIRAVAK